MHYAVVTGILINSEGKFLITKRADWEKAFPSPEATMSQMEELLALV